ncbi:MAG: transcription antitermination factor NusB [Verrucomicrobiota bacterium]
MDSPDSPKKKTKKKPPSPRRDGREAAVQYLYGHDLQGEVDFSDEALEAFWELRLAKPAAQDFAITIIAGVRDHLPDLDDAIRATLENFAFQRLTPVDRNILRVGAYEVLFADEIPWQVAINEAVEVAKRFGGEESPGFINGILDTLRQTHIGD